MFTGRDAALLLGGLAKHLQPGTDRGLVSCRCRRLLRAIPALGGACLLWSAGVRFFCGLFLLGLSFLRDGIAHGLKHGVQLRGVIGVGYDVDDARVLAALFHGHIQDAVFLGQGFELLSVLLLQRDDDRLGVLPVEPLHAGGAYGLIILLQQRRKEGGDVHDALSGQLCRLGSNLKALFDEQIGYFTAHFHKVGFEVAAVFAPVHKGNGIEHDMTVDVVMVNMCCNDGLKAISNKPVRQFHAEGLGLLRGHFAGGKGMDDMKTLYAALLVPAPLCPFHFPVGSFGAAAVDSGFQRQSHAGGRGLVVIQNIAHTVIQDSSTYIIDDAGLVHMASMDIHFTHSTNGVAALHTQILKGSELANFYRLYPEKFNNKTNGITFRRWLLECDPALAAWIESLIGGGFKKDARELEKLMDYVDNDAVLAKFSAIKRDNKRTLADWLCKKQGVRINPDSMFSIQSKRLHEYKRQQLNLLFLIHQYLEIKSGHLPAVPLVSIFGAKAAPAYTTAKDIIHALIALSKVIAADAHASKWMQIVFVENYNVTAAEKVIPACDLSEQISLASKEASGTGNMKFMLNGAVTLGTMDGANVEIAERVGEKNIYIFGQSSDQVIASYARGTYRAKDWYDSDFNIRRAVDFLTGEEMRSAGSGESLGRLRAQLMGKDWFQTFPDFNAYVVRKTQAMQDYATDPAHWARMALINVAKAGFFSSDRTIEEYNRDIWHLG